MKRDRIIALLLILIFSLFCLAREDAAGREGGSGGLKERIAAEKEKLKRTEEKEKGLLKRLNSLSKQIYETEERLSRLKQEISKVNKEIEDLTSELEELNKQLRELEGRLSSRLLVMYRTRHLGYLEAILTSADIASLIRRTHFMRLVATEDAKLIQEAKEKISAISQKKDTLFNKQEELSRLKRIEEVAKRLRESQKADRQAVLTKVRKQKSIYTARIKELEEASLKVKKMISRFEKEKGVPSALSPELLRLKNHLTWPIEGGKILRRFGSSYHPKFGTEATSKGIDIEAPYNEVVRSVLGGKVVFADYFKGYGRLAMIDHGSGLYSLYAHLAQISVEKGQVIGQGMPIGKVGDSGPIGEAGLHFELRINGEPVDPLEWLGRK